MPFIIQYGSLSPWRPSTIDLQVYVYAVRDMLAGGDIYASTTPFWRLYFIYPPIAAVLMIPLAVGPYVLWQVVWTAGLVWAQQSVLRRCGAPRGWKLALIGIAVLVALEPIRTTLGYGQVNTLLMALVVADLLPDAPGERRRIPRGTLIGLAAAIKLTPALFVVFLFLIGKRRAALTAVISFAVFTGLGAVVLPAETAVFFGGLSGGDTRTASPLYTGNQSLLGVFFRLGDSSAVTTVIGLAVAGVVAVLGTLVAAHWWRLGREGVRGGAGRNDHLPGLAAVLDPPLRLDPGPRGGAVQPGDSPLGARSRRVLGGLGGRLPAAGPAAVRRGPGAPVRRAAATGGQPGTGARVDPGDRSGLADGDQHPPRRSRSMRREHVEARAVNGPRACRTAGAGDLGTRRATSTSSPVPVW